MTLDVRELIHQAMVEPRQGVQSLAREIRIALGHGDPDAARTLAYALLALAVENDLAHESLTDAVDWLIRDERTNIAIMQRLHRYAQLAGDTLLEQRLTGRVD
ncbi:MULTISPECIES: hypothetical protein [unclassified Myxococcus]|uniref:hypothetical protein n=1 Tax=unclassified Myxococcus TaxID=2648731 RepID=UPI00157AE540|nr:MULTISPECIES: hypothetical protein [unclassified Myxococcus]NTX01172.1 hypothetical protein [Myxococcus sp. CA040A]NTX33136.1 hypothetical protein [Myxococcus sp. CA033]